VVEGRNDIYLELLNMCRKCGIIKSYMTVFILKIN